jgi:hypothetical protein
MMAAIYLLDRGYAEDRWSGSCLTDGEIECSGTPESYVCSILRPDR